MTKKHFTKEFEAEAVRLVRTSGRTRRDIAHDLGIGLSTLPRWLSQNRDAVMNDPRLRDTNETYGSPCMTRELQNLGFAVGRRRVSRLMRENGLYARQKRRFKHTTDSRHAFPVAPNILDQNFAAEAPNQKWGADISYIWTREGWLYLAVVIDLLARRVVGWSIGDRLRQELAINALQIAIVTRRTKAGLVHHSDRGSQYYSTDYQALLRRNGIRISMSGMGHCYDNAMVETFFKTLKSELVWRTVFLTRRQATVAIARYIDGFYNPTRTHSSLDYLSPIQFEQETA